MPEEEFDGIYLSEQSLEIGAGWNFSKIHCKGFPSMASNVAIATQQCGTV